MKALSLEISGIDSVLKMLRDLTVMLQGIRHNNHYYLKGNTVAGQVATSNSADDDSSQLWPMKLGHTCEKSLQAIAK